MIQTNKIVPIVKELVYRIHSEETDDTSKLKALLKLDRVVMDVMADMLESKANDCNIFILREFIYFFSVYAKAYNFLFDTLKLVEVSGEDKAAIFELISEISDDIDDTCIITEKLNSLLDKKDDIEIRGFTSKEVTETTNQVGEASTEEVKPDTIEPIVEAKPSKPIKKAKQTKV